MNLLTTYYACPNQPRLLEYTEALSRNVDNPHIDQIYLFLEEEDRPSLLTCQNPPAGKIKFIEHAGRPTYNDMFLFCNENLSGETCIISNSDIEFDDTLSIIKNEDLEGHFLCLSRWDKQADGSLAYHRAADSQDCWIFKSPVPPSMTVESNFFMGQCGCDNRIAYVAKKCGLMPTNPSPLIRPIHHHLSEYRTYKWAERVDGYYLRVYPADDWDVSRLGSDICLYEEITDRETFRSAVRLHFEEKEEGV